MHDLQTENVDKNKKYMHETRNSGVQSGVTKWTDIYTCVTVPIYE